MKYLVHMCMCININILIYLFTILKQRIVKFCFFKVIGILNSLYFVMSHKSVDLKDVNI